MPSDSYSGLGNLTTMKPIITPISTSNNKKNEIPKTKTILISEQLYRRFVAHSKRYYNVADYEEILGNLLTEYDKHNSPYIHYTRD